MILLPPALVNLILRVSVRWQLSRVPTPQRLRANFERDARLLTHPPKGAVFRRDRIPRGDDSHLPALWARHGAPGRHRTLLYLHGGAFVAGSPRTHAHLAAALSRAARMRVLLPRYRLAPEHPFPAAIEDALIAYRHLLDRHPADRIAVAGDSAGGGLAFSLLIAAEREGLPPPAAIAAFSPFADLTLSGGSFRTNEARDVMLPAHRAGDLVEHYLQGASPEDPLASPIFASFDRPPPAMITASGSEILRDDAIRLAAALRRAGGDVRLEIWPRLPHAWPALTNFLRAARVTVTAAGRFLDGHTSDKG